MQSQSMAKTRAFDASPNTVDVAVVDMDKSRGVLVGADGNRYVECEPNIWICENVVPCDLEVAYLGTGRHGGGIVLRPAFVNDGGRWINASTGNEAPMALNLPILG